MALHQIGTFGDDRAVRVVVEAPAGTRTKLKYKPDLGAFEAHHLLPEGMSFPYDFGFVPSTLGGDGDPLDALVFADESVPPGTVVPCRLVGVLQAMQSRAGQPPTRNDRFLAVAREGCRHGHWRDLGDIPDAILDQLERFFVGCNAQRGVEFRPAGRGDATAARQLLDEGRERFRRKA